ncbi:MAG TPA: 3-phosphoglycerate dehydrogenase, partial [Bacteroidales bacterium]|nr:3-phosphoglycerate dehydrogenase [Bacteroidales bacterium]
MKILIATEKPFAPVAVTSMKEIVESAGFQLEVLENYKSENELIDAVKLADGLIIRSDLVTPAVIDAAGKLKIVVRAGAGYDNINLEACNAHKVVAMNTPG